MHPSIISHGREGARVFSSSLSQFATMSCALPLAEPDAAGSPASGTNQSKVREGGRATASSCAAAIGCLVELVVIGGGARR